MSSPTQRSLKLMRERGYVAEVTERWIPGANIRKDLWGFCDVLCIGDGGMVAVQSTSRSNVSARIKKITDSPLLGLVRKCGIRVLVQGWGKDRNKRWQVKEVDLS